MPPELYDPPPRRVQLHARLEGGELGVRAHNDGLGRKVLAHGHLGDDGAHEVGNAGHPDLTPCQKGPRARFEGAGFTIPKSKGWRAKVAAAIKGE